MLNWGAFSRVTTPDVSEISPWLCRGCATKDRRTWARHHLPPVEPTGHDGWAPQRQTASPSMVEPLGAESEGPGQWVILSGEYLADIIIKHDYCIQFLSSACVYIYIYMYVLYIYIDFTSWNRNWSRHRNHQYPAVALVTRATLLCVGSITKWKKLDRDWLKGQEGKLSVIVDLYIYNI